jgi:lipopolysaccharide export system permease protein
LLFAFTALTSLLLLSYIARQLGQLVGKGLGPEVIGEFLLLSIPFTFAMTVPMSILVSTLYAFSRLAAENEVTAFKASGTSMWRLLLPVLAMGALFMVGMVLFNDQVLPRANHRLAALQYDIVRTKPTFALKEQVINELQRERLYLRASRVLEGTSRLVDVTVYDLTDPTRRRTIYADSGMIAFAPNMQDLHMTLYDGVMQEVPTDKPQQLTRLFYRIDRIRVPDVASQFSQTTATGQSKSDREMTVCEMNVYAEAAERRRRQAMNEYHKAVVAVARARGRTVPAAKRLRLTPGPSLGSVYCDVVTAVAGLVRPRTLEAATLVQRPGARVAVPEPDVTLAVQRRDDALQQAQSNQTEANKYLVEIHKKFALAFACFVFVLVGAPIALRFPRGGVGLTLGVSFGIFGLYYVGLISGESLADRDILSPGIAMWFTNMLMLALGLVLAVRMGRESGSQRGGGGFTELLARIQDRVTGQRGRR